MRVGLLIYGSLEMLSGGYIYDRKLAEHLKKQGDSVEVISLPVGRYFPHLWQNFDQSLSRKLVNLPVDVLLQDELNHPSLALLNGAIKHKVKYPIYSIVHHLRSNEDHSGYVMWLYRMVERRYLNSVAGFIFNSHTTRQTVESLRGSETIHVVANPAGDRFGPPLAEDEITRRSRETGPRRFLFVGNLIPRKGLHYAIEALSRLRDQDWILRIVGRKDVDPGYVGWLKALVNRLGLEARVQFLGQLSVDQLAAEYKNGQVLVVPSYEGFGIVYLEGMNFGLPAVASIRGAAGEIITSHQDGVLLNPENIQEFSSELLRFCIEPDYLLSMSLAARRRFLEFPSWEESMQRVRTFVLDQIQ
jgi:glycosyltransferase involved in cell wall biosynthesis